MDQNKEMKEQDQSQDLETIELPPTPDDLSCSVLSAQDLDDINPEIIEAFQEAEQEQDKLNDNKPDPYAPSAPFQPTQDEPEPEEDKPKEEKPKEKKPKKEKPKEEKSKEEKSKEEKSKEEKTKEEKKKEEEQACLLMMRARSSNPITLM